MGIALWLKNDPVFDEIRGWTKNVDFYLVDV
jgi:hypothetical protein